MMHRGFGFVMAVALTCSFFGCESADPNLKEWSVEDHKHRTEKRTRRERDQVRNHARPQKKDQLASVAWSGQCAGCHGAKGKGDGPQAVMVKPKDLTAPAWQDSVTDTQIAEVIRRGKNKMPAFNLPDSTVDGLVAYVRDMRFRTREERIRERQERRAQRAQRSKQRRRPKGGAEGTASQTLPTAPPSPSGATGQVSNSLSR